MTTGMIQVSEHLLKLLAAYAAGTTATAVMVRLVWFIPIPGYTKHILSWVVPLPVILIVLAMLYYGPASSVVENEPITLTSSGVARVFLLGSLSTFALFAAAPLVKMALRRLKLIDEEDEEESDDE